MKSLKDIRTSTGRKGATRQIPVAINLSLGGTGTARNSAPRPKPEPSDWSGNAVKNHLHQKTDRPPRPPNPKNPNKALEGKILERLGKDLIECKDFCGEDIPGSKEWKKLLEASLAKMLARFSS